jgi:hypothetical protein
MDRTIRTGTRAALSCALSLTVAGCGVTVAPDSVDQSTRPTAEITADPADPTVRSTPSSTAAATPAYVASGPLPAGFYYVDLGRVRFTFKIPDGWVGPSSTGFAVLKEGPTERAAMILSFWSPANVYADVCDDRSLLDPPIGPTVGDFAIALADQSGTEATDPTPITVDGHRGQRVDLSVRSGVAGCPGAMWLWLDKDGGTRSTDGDEDTELSILDVDGERVVIYVLYRPETSEAERAELRAIFDTIQIEV